MPFLRVSLHKGRTPAQIRALIDAVYQALHRSFEVPAGDRFAVVHQHEAGEFFYDVSYLGMQRTDDLVFIQIFAGKVRSVETKREFYRDVCESLASVCGLSRDDVFVSISTNAGEDWSFGRGDAQLIESRAR